MQVSESRRELRELRAALQVAQKEKEQLQAEKQASGRIPDPKGTAAREPGKEGRPWYLWAERDLRRILLQGGEAQSSGGEKVGFDRK